MLSRERILQILSESRDELRRDFGVVVIALVGSAARGEAGPTSDIDVLVDLNQQISLFELVALRLRLEERLEGAHVDVVLQDSIFPPLREKILSEAVSVT